MLGHRKNKWTAEEEEALVAGIAKHGSGKWANIIEDPEFAPHLLDRTNINLKDKWRNMKNRVGNLEKSIVSSSSRVVVSNEPSPSSSSDMSNDTRYVPMVFEAISTIKDEDGSDIKEILSFIEERHEVPKTIKKLLSSIKNPCFSRQTQKDYTNPSELPNTYVISTKLKETQGIDAAANKVAERINELAEEFDVGYEERQDFRMFLSECLKILVTRGKLEKVLDGYKMSELERKVLEIAPEVVAMKLAESDNKRLIAAEALEEEKRMHKLVEESNTMLQLCLEIHQQCALGEEVVLW